MSIATQTRSWLEESRERIVHGWWDAMSRHGLPPSRDFVEDLLTTLANELQDPDGPSPEPACNGPAPEVLFGLRGMTEALSSLACLRGAILEQMERRQPADALAIVSVIDARLDRWMIAVSQAQYKHIQDSLTALSRDLNQQLADRSRAMRETLLKLESLERTKSDFVSIAAHELKTPLTLTRGYASILAEEAKKSGSERFSELAAGILRGADRLGRLIDDLIDAAAIDMDMLELHRGLVYLGKLATMAVAEVYSEAPGRHHQVNILDLDRLPPIEGDTQRLYQMLLQVISNAMKFTPDGGRIDISGRLLYAQRKGDSDGFVDLCVADTGIGVDPRDQQAIFEKFYRTGDPSLHSTSRARFKGAGPGLGLAIARGIVRAHGGVMWVESEGCDEVRCPGSSFHMLLPIKAGPNASQTEELLRRQMLKLADQTRLRKNHAPEGRDERPT